MTESDRFQDNSSGIITDSKHKNHWLPKDSWGDLAQWRNYDEALAYVRLMNQVYAGGFSDWRLPTSREAEEFYDETFDHMDWEDEIIAGSVVTHDGVIKNEAVKKLLEGKL